MAKILFVTSMKRTGIPHLVKIFFNNLYAFIDELHSQVKSLKNFKTQRNYEYSISISIDCQFQFFYIIYDALLVTVGLQFHSKLLNQIVITKHGETSNICVVQLPNL